MIDGAIDQFAIEKNKRPGEAVRWEDIVPYLQPGSRLAVNGGRPYALGRIGDGQVKVHPQTVGEFNAVAENPTAFWGDYLPEGVDFTPTQRPAAGRRRATSAVLR